MEVNALYSLYPPIKADSEQAVWNYNAFCQDYSQKKAIKIKGSAAHDGETLWVRAIPCTARHLKKQFQGIAFLQKGDALIEFSGRFKFPGPEKWFLTKPDGTRTKDSPSELKRFWQQFLPNDLNLTIQTYLLALSIAYCGAVRPTRNVWTSNRKLIPSEGHFVSIIHDAIEFLRENNAFADFDVTADQVINWVFSQNGIFDGYSDTPASRSLNYFTRLFVDDFRNDELSDLVWALAGVEAILVEGGRSSVGQLREKL